MNLDLIQRIYYLEKEIERLETLETAIGVAGGGAITLIDTKTTTTPTFSFTNIPATYRHLLLIGSIRADDASEGNLTQLTFNGVAAPNVVYDSYHSYFFGAGSTNSNNAQRIVVSWFPSANCPASMFGPFSCWIFFYAKTDRNRQIKSNWAYGKDNTAPDIEAGNGTVCGHWNNAASAINRVDLATWNAVANFVAGSTVTLFGVG